jgi:hypothetical protein
MSTATLNSNWIARETVAATATVGETTFIHEVGTVFGFSAGTGDGQIDKVYSASLTVAGAGGTMLDLLGGLTDKSGAAINFVKVKGIILHNQSTTKTVTIGPDATNGWFGAAAPFAAATDAQKVTPGGEWTWKSPGGLAPGAGATDEIYIANAGAVDAVVEILIVGSSA